MMKKLLVLCICFVGAVTTLQAQGGAVAKVAKGTKHVAERTKGAAGRTKPVYVKPDIVVRTGTAGLSTSVERQAAQAARNATRSGVPGTNLGNGIVIDQSVVGQKPPLNPAADGQLSVKQAQDQYRAALEAQKKRLEDERKRLLAENQALKFQTDFGKSVLFAPNIALERNPSLLDEEENYVRGYSMTIIKHNYKGKEEIFGVIPTHALPQTAKAADLAFGITRKFHTQVILPDGSIKLILGEVVQVSAHSMLDITLVKFNPADEKFLSPLELVDKDTPINEPVRWTGFANERPMEFERTVTKKSLISVRTDEVKVPNDEFQGICGSPLLTTANKVLAVHTGVHNGDSYGTPARFIDLLIEAYHNDGKAMYDLELDGEVLTSLNVDEYISAFAIADESKQVIYKKDGLEKNGDTWDKYSETKLREAMHNPQGRYLILHSRTPVWLKGNKSDEFYLAESRNDMNVDMYQLREHVYDLKNHQLLREPYTYSEFYENEFYDIDEHPMLILKQLDGFPARR